MHFTDAATPVNFGTQTPSGVRGKSGKGFFGRIAADLLREDLRVNLSDMACSFCLEQWFASHPSVVIQRRQLFNTRSYATVVLKKTFGGVAQSVRATAS